MKQKKSESEMVWKTIFWIYMLALIVVVSFKGMQDLRGFWAERTSGDWSPRYNLTLFRTVGIYLKHYHVGVYSMNIWGNILPFVPLGLLMPLAFAPLRGFVKVSGLSFLIIVAIESLQLVTGLGSFDVDDILLNTLSAMLGYTVYKLFTLPRSSKKSSGNGSKERKSGS